MEVTNNAREVFRSELTFKVWEYKVSHSQLLIRSPISTGGNLDLIFQAVSFVCLPTIFRDGVVVSALDDIEPIGPVSRDDLEPSSCVFLLKAPSPQWVVVASRLRVEHNDLELFESSLESFNDTEPRTGRLIVSASRGDFYRP